MHNISHNIFSIDFILKVPINAKVVKFLGWTTRYIGRIKETQLQYSMQKDEVVIIKEGQLSSFTSSF